MKICPTEFLRDETRMNPRARKAQ